MLFRPDQTDIAVPTQLLTPFAKMVQQYKATTSLRFIAPHRFMTFDTALRSCLLPDSGTQPSYISGS